MRNGMRCLVIAILAAQSSCAQLAPARSTELAPGRYELRASGNVYSSIESLQLRLDEKASALCGRMGYSYEGTSDFNIKKQEVYTASGNIDTSRMELSRVVACNTEL